MTQHLVLYYSPGACSLAAHVVLYEIGAPFEAKRVMLAQGEHHTPEFLALNPRARVPLLQVNGRPVRELSAILTWLGQQGEGLCPATGTYEAAKCAEWLAWLTSSLHISFAQIWRGERFVDDAALYPQVRARGFTALAEQYAEIESQLAANPYMLGDVYSVADANVLPFYRWGNRVGFNMREEYPAYTAHAERMLTRPAVQKALAAEGVDLWQGPDPGGVVR